MFWIIVLLVLALVVGLVVAENKKVAAMAPDERGKYLSDKQAKADAALHGPINYAMNCPHCGTKGKVRTKMLDRKKGISGGKATAAVMTAGVSMLATGLSRKEKVTRARCDHCKNAWDF